MLEILHLIESYLVTLQQEVGFKEYSKECEDGNRRPGCVDFQEWYMYWCYEEGLFNDITESNFPREGILEDYV